jgi:hypothetical protein
VGPIEIKDATWGIETLGVRRVEWRAYLGNSASRGQRRDTWIGALVAEDVA